MEKQQQAGSKKRDQDKGKRKVEKGNASEDEEDISAKRKKASTERQPSSIDEKLVSPAPMTSHQNKASHRSELDLERIQIVRSAFALEVTSIRQEFPNITDQMDLVLSPWGESATMLYPAKVVLDLAGISDGILMQHPFFTHGAEGDNTNDSESFVLISFLYRNRLRWVKRHQVKWTVSLEDLDTLNVTKGAVLTKFKALLMRLQKACSIKQEEKKEVAEEENELALLAARPPESNGNRLLDLADAALLNPVIQPSLAGIINILPSESRSEPVAAKETEATRSITRAIAFVSTETSRIERFNSLDEPEITSTIRWAYHGKGPEEVVTYIPGCNTSIKRNSICRLSQTQWLDCDILGAYAQLINERNGCRRDGALEVPQHGGDEGGSSVRGEEKRSGARVHCFDTFFYTLLVGNRGAYDYEKVRQYTEPKRRRSGISSGVSIVNTDIVMVPVHIEGNHWVLSIIDMKAGVLFFADPQDLSKNKKSSMSRKKVALQILGNLRRWLEEELQTKNGVTMVNERRVCDFQLQWDLLVPKQRDSGSCGVFTMMYGEAIEWYGHVGTFDFNARNTRGMRDRMTLELLAKRLSVYKSS